MEMEQTCKLCKKSYIKELTLEEYTKLQLRTRWLQEDIASMFPSLSKEDAVFLTTGICSVCQTQVQALRRAK